MTPPTTPTVGTQITAGPWFFQVKSITPDGQIEVVGCHENGRKLFRIWTLTEWRHRTEGITENESRC